MKPSRHLDRQFATLVLGWELLSVGHFGGDDETPRQVELQEWMDAHGLDSVGDFYIVDLQAGKWIAADDFTPSVNIRDAWRAVERFALLQIGGADATRYRDEFVRELEEQGVLRLMERQAALSICEIALKVIGALPTPPTSASTPNAGCAVKYDDQQTYTAGRLAKDGTWRDLGFKAKTLNGRVLWENISTKNGVLLIRLQRLVPSGPNAGSFECYVQHDTPMRLIRA